MNSVVLGYAVFIAAIVVSFFSISKASGLIVALEIYFVLWLWAQRKWYLEQPELWKYVAFMQASTQRYFRTFGHYYAHKAKCERMVIACGTMQWTGCAVSAVQAFQNEWWMISFGVGNWLFMSLVASRLDPTIIMKKSALRLSHHLEVESCIPKWYKL